MFELRSSPGTLGTLDISRVAADWKVRAPPGCFGVHGGSDSMRPHQTARDKGKLFKEWHSKKW